MCRGSKVSERAVLACVMVGNLQHISQMGIIPSKKFAFYSLRSYFAINLDLPSFRLPSPTAGPTQWGCIDVSRVPFCTTALHDGKGSLIVFTASGPARLRLGKTSQCGYLFEVWGAIFLAVGFVRIEFNASGSEAWPARLILRSLNARWI